MAWTFTSSTHQAKPSFYALNQLKLGWKYLLTEKKFTNLCHKPKRHHVEYVQQFGVWNQLVIMFVLVPLWHCVLQTSKISWPQGKWIKKGTKMDNSPWNVHTLWVDSSYFSQYFLYMHTKFVEITKKNEGVGPKMPNIH